MFRKVFERIVRQCMDAGLVKGEGFAVDASVIEADASRFQRIKGSEVDWTEEQLASRPVREYLAALDGEQSPTNPERKPKALSPTDPTAASTTRGRNKVMFGHSLNYLIDMEHAKNNGGILRRESFSEGGSHRFESCRVRHLFQWVGGLPLAP